MRLTTLTRAALAAMLPAVLVAAQPAGASEAIFGRWLTGDGNAVVRIGRCGATLCGMVERVLNPRVPVNDINNPDPARRTRPLVGTAVLSGFTPAGGRWDGGQAYDPKGGRSYKSHLSIEPDGKLKVTGCIAFICRSQYWTRAS